MICLQQTIDLIPGLIYKPGLSHERFKPGLLIEDIQYKYTICHSFASMKLSPMFTKQGNGQSYRKQLVGRFEDQLGCASVNE